MNDQCMHDDAIFFFLIEQAGYEFVAMCLSVVIVVISISYYSSLTLCKHVIYMYNMYCKVILT